MEGRDFELYNFCLFKTISLVNLKEALLAKIVNFSPSDTYAMLTLRMRRAILENLDIQHSVIESIDLELEVFEKTKQRTGSGYDCSVPGCTFRCFWHRKYVAHLDLVHYNTKSRVVCQFRHDCSRDFPSVNLLKSHLKRYHEKKESSVSIRQNQLVEEIVTLKCQEKSCSNQLVTSIVALKKHMLTHTDRKELVQCIFCGYRTNTSGTFKSHCSLKHKLQNINSLNPKIIKHGDLSEEVDFCPVIDDREEEEVEVEDILGAEDLDEVNEYGEEEDAYDEVFIKALANTMNTWMNISGVPYSTVNEIVKELFASYEKGKDYIQKKLRNKLINDQIDPNKIEEILSVIDEDPFSAARKELEMERKRKNFILSNFPNVEPETILLSSESDSRRESMQYVSVLKSLKLLFEDPSYISQKLEDPYHYEDDVIKDTRDGSTLKQNLFFQENPDAVPLVMFIDELEVANPLGAAKTKHKINCSYLTTLTVQPPLRSKVKSIQLVSRVRSIFWKKHGNSKCNARLISDLKVLEEKGITVVAPYEHNVKAGLAYIVGDNLGQHNISEISQSFSSGNICRWCKATHKEVCKEGMGYSGCKDDFNPEVWTADMYDENAGKALEDEEAETFGIKRHCTFNQLKSFHCVNQTPPCLGHDYYEGVYSYDIQFYLDYIINKEKLLDMDSFNLKLRNVMMSDRDKKNRPKDFKTRTKGSKYEGNAGSIRVLSRILPLILSNVLDESEVGEHIVKLSEVSELITAPRLTVDEIEQKLKFCIIEYLEMRIEAIESIGMGTIKPKHHFLSHYCELFTSCGPLIFLWAMRMEAKHTFFKNCIRTSKINVSKTCASRHQMAQISYSYSGLFPRKLNIPAEALKVKEMKHVNPNPLIKLFMSKLDQNDLVPTKITVFGTIYEPGMVLVKAVAGFGEKMIVGILQAIAVQKGEVVFACVSFEAQRSSYGFYVTTKQVAELEVVKHSDLADPHPLKRIGPPEAFRFCFHHYISARS